MSWLWRGSRAGEPGHPGTEVTFEYLPLPPHALLRVGAPWPDEDRTTPDMTLIVDDGTQRHELEPLPDPGGSAGDSGWHIAFAAPASIVEAPEASFALRIGDEDVPLAAPTTRDLRAEIAEPKAVPGGAVERLATIAAELSRRDELDEQIRVLASEREEARRAADEAERRATAAGDAQRVAEATLDQLVETHAQLEGWARGAGERQASADSEIVALSQEVEGLRATVTDAERRAAEAERRAVDSGREIDEAARARSAAEAARTMAEERLEDAAVFRDQLESRIQRLQSEIDDAKREVEQRDAAAADLRRRAAEADHAERVLDEVRRERAEAESAREAAEERAAQAEAARGPLERRIRELEGSIDEAREHADQEAVEEARGVAEELASAADQVAAALGERVAEIESALSASSERETSAQNELAELRRRNDELEREAREAAARQEQLTDSKAELEQVLAAGSADREARESQIRELESTLEHLRGTLSGGRERRLLTALVRSRERLEDAQARHERLHVGLTDALFHDRGASGSGSDAQLQASVEAEQSALEAMEEARAEMERNWAEAGKAVRGVSEPGDAESASSAPSQHA